MWAQRWRPQGGGHNGGGHNGGGHHGGFHGHSYHSAHNFYHTYWGWGYHTYYPQYYVTYVYEPVEICETYYFVDGGAVWYCFVG